MVTDCFYNALMRGLAVQRRGDLKGGLFVLYSTLESDGSYRRLTTDPALRQDFDEAVLKYFSSDYFRPLYKNSALGAVIPGYLGASVEIYTRWKQGMGAISGIKDVEALADYTATLFYNGLTMQKRATGV